MITIRPATGADSDKLLAWRNDPETQASSRSTAPVPQDAHARWMMMNVMQGYPMHMVMIAEADFGELGVVRFDSRKSDAMHYEVGITIAPQFRGRGLAARVLACACDHMAEFTIHAEVRKENIPSRRLFARCGFEEVGRSSGYLNYRKEPQ